jgi:NAD+ synthase
MVYPELDRPEWALEPSVAAAGAVAFMRDITGAAGINQLVVGLSGGIDSAVAAGLAVKALGAENVLGIMMPYATSSAASLTDAQAVAEYLGMKTEKVDITPLANPFLDGIPSDQQVRRGNIMARCRMMVLYDRSARDGSLVLGTGNRTEGLLGYTTMFGDNACALNPIGQLYKTEVRLLSAWLELPASVLTKAPSADLWEGQSDEDELGFTYAEVDHLLHHMIDEGLADRQLASLGFGVEMVTRVRQRVRAMAFKRQLAPVAAMEGRPDPDARVGAPEETVDDFKDGGFH